MNFERDINPLESMNIGLNRTKFNSIYEFAELLVIILPSILGTKEIPEDILVGSAAINDLYFNQITNYIIDKKITINNNFWDYGFGGESLSIPLAKKLEKNGFQMEPWKSENLKNLKTLKL